MRCHEEREGKGWCRTVLCCAVLAVLCCIMLDDVDG